MKVAIRADASLKIGAGHIMRCMTLANTIRENGGTVHFICRTHKGHLATTIENNDFHVHLMESGCDELDKNRLFHSEWLETSQKNDAEQCYPILKAIQPDWLIVDHYAIDKRWQLALQKTYEKLMVIDDLGDREQSCDLLLDQNYGSNPDKYKALVPEKCKILTGANYALLRPEFPQWRDYSLRSRLRPQLNSILITLGGVDPDNYTGQILEKLSKVNLPKAIRITVIMGATAPHLLEVQKVARAMPYSTDVKNNVSNMAELMANSDLAIGAAGATTWERCCLGLPSIQVVIADNQRKIAENLSNINAIKYIKNVDEIPLLITTALTWMPSVSQVASQLCDGMGAKAVMKHLNGLGWS
jgi:UDP-2,4-diacetamido-2,4,6-trideoxy-beta-L-altropyranose hydrolase